MSKKLVGFGYSNNYLESIIAKILGFNSKTMGYLPNGVMYYYWYDKKQKQMLIDNINEIQNEICKLEECIVKVDKFQCEDNEITLILQRNQ